MWNSEENENFEFAPWNSEAAMKNVDPLPKTLPGTVCVQWVCCNRKNCRCARGQRHGPYYYRIWREEGRIRKCYIRLQDLESIRAKCQARPEMRRQVKKSFLIWQALRDSIRGLETSTTGFECR